MLFRSLRFTTPDTNAAWGKEHRWIEGRPIELSTMFWLRFHDVAKDTPPERHLQWVHGEVKDGNRIELTTKHVAKLRVFLHPRMVDLQKPVTITANGKQVFSGLVAPDLGMMLELVREFADRGRVFHAVVDVGIDGDRDVPEPRGS